MDMKSGADHNVSTTAIQQKIFESLKLTPEELKVKFGFFIDALSYGTPPHLGIALGLDRIMMILTQTENIRDVIAFPKTQKASDLMLQSPSKVAATAAETANRGLKCGVRPDIRTFFYKKCPNVRPDLP